MLKIGVVAGMAPVLAMAAVQVPAGPAGANESSTVRRLRDFYVPEGLVRYGEEIEEFKQKLAERGLPYDPVNLGVFEVPTVDGPTRYITDRPDAFEVRGVSDLLRYDPELGYVSANVGFGQPVVSESRDVFEVVPMVTAASSTSSDNVMVNPAIGNVVSDTDDDGTDAHWTRRKDASSCYFVGTDRYERWVCYYVLEQANDDDADRDYWQLHVDVSGHTVDSYMEKMWVEGVPLPRDSHTQEYDGIPLPDASWGGAEGCRTDGHAFSISSGVPVQIGLEWYWERQTCETYTPKTYGSEAGHWASIWQGNDLAYPDAQRYVLLKIPVKTPVGDGVGWALLTGQWSRRQ